MLHVLKSVLHNWPDKPASRILQAVASAMPPGASAYVVERVMPERPSSCAAGRESVRADLQMLVGCDGRERTQAQFQELLAAAGLHLRRRTALVGGFFALEATRN